MKSKGKPKGMCESAAARCASSLISTVATGLAAIFLGIAAIYALHPYLAILALLLLASFLVKVSDNAEGDTKKIAAATAAVAVFLLMFAIPSGDLGSSKCPDNTIPGTIPGATVKYFYSPFCTSCIFSEKNLDDAQKQAGFTLQYYDIRYCKADKEKYGFPGTPCFAFVSRNGTTQRACGVLSTDEIVEMAGS